MRTRVTWRCSLIWFMVKAANATFNTNPLGEISIQSFFFPIERQGGASMCHMRHGSSSWSLTTEEQFERLMCSICNPTVFRYFALKVWASKDLPFGGQIIRPSDSEHKTCVSLSAEVGSRNYRSRRYGAITRDSCKVCVASHHMLRGYKAITGRTCWRQGYSTASWST